ncbi:MAG: hypothetical protein AAGJ54_06145 [Planctomycetota bacterium]
MHHVLVTFEKAWSSRQARLARAGTLTAVLLGGILLIELGRRGLLQGMSESLPSTHLAAIEWTVTVLLVFEIVEMVLSLPQSVASSVGRHLQLYALVLLRDAFAELGHFNEPIAISSENTHELLVMGSDAAGAVLLFTCAIGFERLQRHRPITGDSGGASRFVAIKRTIAVLLIGLLAFLSVQDLVSLVQGENRHALFDTFFTTLVFVDVLLAVVAIAVSEVPAVIFRNFGFAFAAILLRLAIASPEFLRPSLGLAGGLTAIAVTLAYNLALTERTAGEKVVESSSAG